jgi:hypothetical protein
MQLLWNQNMNHQATTLINFHINLENLWASLLQQLDMKSKGYIGVGSFVSS